MKSLMLLILAFLSFTVASPIAAQNANPFRQGVNLQPLTKSDQASLLEWVNRAKLVLEEALRKGNGKSLREAGDLYMNAIRVAVIESFDNSRRGELLMRFVLSQALDLTYGIPTPDGRTFETKGVLQGTVQEDLIAIILEDSIRLALKVIPADVKCIQRESLVDLPFGEVAASRIVLARRWLASTFEWTGGYDLAVTALKHWFVTVNDPENMRRFADAGLILEVNDVLQTEVVGYRSQDPNETVRRLRVLRGLLRRVEKTVSASAKFVPSENRLLDESTKADGNALDQALANSFGGQGSRLSLEQMLVVASKMSEIEKANSVRLDFFRANISTLSNKEVNQIYSALSRSYYDSDDKKLALGRVGTSKIMLKLFAAEILTRRRPIADDLEFFSLAKSWAGAGLTNFNAALEENLTSRLAELTFSELESGIKILASSHYASDDRKLPNGAFQTKNRLIDAWYFKHR